MCFLLVIKGFIFAFITEMNRILLCRCTSEKAKAAALNFLPILKWLPSYPVKQYLFSDVVSGLSTGVVQLPQGQCPKKISKFLSEHLWKLLFFNHSDPS